MLGPNLIFSKVNQTKAHEVVSDNWQVETNRHMDEIEKTEEKYIYLDTFLAVSSVILPVVKLSNWSCSDLI